MLVLLAVLGMLSSVAVAPALAQPPQSGVPTPANVVRARVLFVATFTPSWTEFTELTVTQLTKGADVVLSCRGHGCPLISRTSRRRATSSPSLGCSQAASSRRTRS